MNKIKFNCTKYDFESKAKLYLDYQELNKIHNDHKFLDLLIEGTDQSQHLHRMFYKGMDNDEDFVDLYVSFIKDIIYPRYNEELLYQKFPTFRVHQPGNLGTFGWHKDSDYNHSPLEVNYFLPITSAYETNTVWYESEPRKEDFQPMTAEYGDLMEWDGANCMHGTKINETNDTRISFDFRVLTLDDYYKYSPKESLTKGTKFNIGGYFELLEI